MIIDTHVHYNLEPLASSWPLHWQKAQESGVKKAIIVGSNLADSQTALDITKTETNLLATVGLHPDNYSDQKALNHWLVDGKFDLDKASADIETNMVKLKLMINQPKVVAIGEIGLDYYWLDREDQQQFKFIKQVQRQAFIEQLKLAQTHQLPVVIHCRDKETPEVPSVGNAYWDLLTIMTDFNDLSFVLHCVSGPLQYIKQMNYLNAFMGFDGNITYTKAEQIRTIFSLCPQDKRLLETDAPYLPPQQFRGKTCEPWMISLTAQYLESNFEQSLAQIRENSLNFFQLSNSF